MLDRCSLSRSDRQALSTARSRRAGLLRTASPTFFRQGDASIPQNFSLNLFLSTCQRKNWKKITDAVSSMDQNLLIEQTHFLSAVGCERR